jgi:hypothetical protein
MSRTSGLRQDSRQPFVQRSSLCGKRGCFRRLSACPASLGVHSEIALAQFASAISACLLI